MGAVFSGRHKATATVLRRARLRTVLLSVYRIECCTLPVWQWQPSRRLASPTSWGRVTDKHGVLTTASPGYGRVGGASSILGPEKASRPKGFRTQRPRELAGGRNLDGSCLAHEPGRVESTLALGFHDPTAEPRKARLRRER